MFSHNYEQINELMYLYYFHSKFSCAFYPEWLYILLLQIFTAADVDFPLFYSTFRRNKKVIYFVPGFENFSGIHL